MENKYPPSSFIAGLSGDYYHAGFTSDNIVASEVKGQENLVNSTQLPIAGEWQILESWGIKRTGSSEGLFCDATLPLGWIKRATENTFWSELIDEKGRKRASIFYKAAYYDRDATVTPIVDRFIATQENYPHKGYLSYNAIDLARNRNVIYTGSVGYFAFKTDDPTILGFVVDDVFYYNAIRESYGNEFFADSEPAQELTALVDDEIYKKYHHINPIHETLDAANKKARENVDNFIQAFLGDRDPWEID